MLALDWLFSRDRLAFSKSILRRFIRDCVDRDAAVASPWTVKPPVAARYGVDSVMPEATRQGVEDIKKGEIQKRKKVWEDKEGPLKKQKKLSAAREEKGDGPSRSVVTILLTHYQLSRWRRNVRQRSYLPRQRQSDKQRKRRGKSPFGIRQKTWMLYCLRRIRKAE